MVDIVARMARRRRQAVDGARSAPAAVSPAMPEPLTAVPDVEGPTEPAAADQVDPLAWLSGILWPDGHARLIPERRLDRRRRQKAAVVAGGDDARHVGFRWWASPSPASAEILIPATSPAAARTAVRRYHDGFSAKRRVRSLLAEALMRAPALARRLLEGRLVATSGAVDDGLLTDLLTAVAPDGDAVELHIAITLARNKSNRKPVLQLIDEGGNVLGWAKIGWNPWTSDLLANEAHWLRKVASSPLVLPTLDHDLSLHGHRVIVTDGFTPSRLPRRGSTAPPPPELFLAVAGLGTRGRRPLRETPWWASVEQVVDAATPDERAAIEQVVELVGAAELEIGAWHGDFTPWNIMAASGGGLVRRDGATPWFQVIDWEFAADGVPLGFDLCHFHTQVAAEMGGRSAAEALNHSARLSPQGLASLGVDPHNQIHVFRLYLVELIRRTLALRAAGMPVDQVHQGRAAVDRIRLDTSTADIAADRTGMQPAAGRQAGG